MFEDDLGEYDDTAVNGLRFRCLGIDTNENDTATEKTAGEGDFGSWREWSSDYHHFKLCGV